MTTNRLRTGIPGGMTANGLVFVIVAYAALLFGYDSDLYYLSVQEDEYLEWATFWAFLAAAGINVVAAVRHRRSSGMLPWFLPGVALFCFFVAMEEISWGQRILGYRPPVYFLDQNYQQELNIHNVVDTQYRKLALTAVILGYGVILPALQQVPALDRLFARLGIVAPPLGLLPTFMTAYILYIWYPWRHSGEWVEMLLGLGFLFTALVSARQFRKGFDGDHDASFPLRLPLLAGLVVVVMGIATALAVRYQRQAHPGNLTAARSELSALKKDFESGRVGHRCSLHKRLYTFVQQYDQIYLDRGEFSRLRLQGLPEERAAFFLDPWNSPYWVRDRCASGERPRTKFVYSLGPNRRRDSTQWELLDDDIGAYIRPGGRP